MPHMPKHPCPHPGCGALVEYDSTYCTAHREARATHRREVARRYDGKRTEAKFYHSARWKGLRDWFLTQHPLCEVCLREGRVEPAKIVDHIVEIKDGGARYDTDNLQALCDACHNKKTSAARKSREA